MNDESQLALAKLLRAVRVVLVIAVVGTAAACAYLLFTQPKNSVPPQSEQVSLAVAQPITKRLPYNDPYFIVGYKTIGTSNNIVVTIHTTSPRYRYYALKQIYILGFDPTDYTIEYSDFNNPLGN